MSTQQSTEDTDAQPADHGAEALAQAINNAIDNGLSQLQDRVERLEKAVFKNDD